MKITLTVLSLLLNHFKVLQNMLISVAALVTPPTTISRSLSEIGTGPDAENEVVCGKNQLSFFGILSSNYFASLQL
jgi:hypothetical protein